MKKLVILGMLLLGVSGQAMSIGHPHNLFAARKQLKLKKANATCVTRTPKPTWTAVQQVRTSVAAGSYLLGALSKVASLR